MIYNIYIYMYIFKYIYKYEGVVRIYLTEIAVENGRTYVSQTSNGYTHGPVLQFLSPGLSQSLISRDHVHKFLSIIYSKFMFS